METTVAKAKPHPPKRKRVAHPELKPEWGSIQDCITISGLSAPTLWRAIRLDAFRSIKAGNTFNARRLIHLDGFRAWIANGAKIPRPIQTTEPDFDLTPRRGIKQRRTRRSAP